MPKHRTETRVRYAETDRSGVVYNANYLVYFEIGRTEMLRDLGCTYAELEERGFVFPVVEARLRYRAPARYDDALRIESEVVRVGRVRFAIATEVWRVEPERLLADGLVELACTDGAGRVIPLPPDVLRLLENDISRKAGEGASSQFDDGRDKETT